MGKNILYFLLLLYPIIGRSAVGDSFIYDNIWYSITKEYVQQGNGYIMGEVQVGYGNGWTSNGSGDIVLPQIVKYNKHDYNVTKIGNNAFRGTTAITSVKVEFDIRSIGECAFYGCTSLKSIEFNNSISVGEEAFYNCSSLESFPFEKLSTINSSAFYGCSSLKTVILNASQVKSSAFENCTSLSSVCLKASQASLSSQSFKNCKALKNVYLYFTEDYFDIPYYLEKSVFEGISEESILHILNGTLSYYDMNSQWREWFSQIVIMPPSDNYSSSSFISIGEDSEKLGFAVTNLQNMEVAITSIEEGVLSSKNKSVGLDIPSFIIDKDYQFKIISIGKSVFSGTKIKTLSLPQSLKSIDDYAFADCLELEEVYIPNSVSQIGNSFETCSNLAKVTIDNRFPSNIDVSGNCFKGISSEAILYVPAGTKKRYEAIETWNKFSHIVEISPISAGDIETYQGSSVNLPINLNNTEEIAGVQFRLTLPAGVSVVQDEGELVISLTDRITGFTVMGIKDPKEENSYSFILFSLAGTPIAGNEGAIMNLCLSIDPDMEIGDFKMSISDVQMATSSFETRNPQESVSDLTVTKAPAKGDVNRDDFVDVADVVMMVNYILGSGSTSFSSYLADMNDDGEVDVFDITKVIDIILSTPSLSRTRGEFASAFDEQMTFEKIKVKPENNSVYLDIDYAERFTAFQFDVILPDGVDITNVLLAGGITSHNIQYIKLNANLYRVLGLSLNNSSLPATISNLIEVQLTGAVKDKLYFDNILFITNKEEKVRFINEILKESDTVNEQITIYDLRGHKLDKQRKHLEKGVYIINNKKVIIK